MQGAIIADLAGEDVGGVLASLPHFASVLTEDRGAGDQRARTEDRQTLDGTKPEDAA